jgi:nucleoid-associated protein YgaU
MTVVRRIAIIAFIIAILLVSFGAIGNVFHSTPTTPTHTRPVATAPTSHKPMADHLKLAPLAKSVAHHSHKAVKAVKRYTVHAGDSLWSIAKSVTGNGANWTHIYQMNRAAIGSNPNLIHVGLVLIT